MAKIIYGVSGEGSGHSSRAKLVGKHLVDAGHTVKMVSYDRGFKNLKDDFDVLEIVGLSIASRDNKVSMLNTLAENINKFPDGKRAFDTLKELFKRFQPDCVFTDFEPSTAYLANHYNVPLVSMDNQHRMRYMKYQCPPDLKKEALLTETIIRAMVPRPWFSLITSFHYGELKNQHCQVVPPLLRKNVTNLKATEGKHILVYVTSGFDSLLEELKKFTRETFYVYGYDKDEVEGNLQYRPFSQDGFLADLASSKAVVATAGFTLISEALHLAKPYLAFPMKGQFEQNLNAYMLDQQGFGKQCLHPTRESIAAFLYLIPEFKIRLAQYEGNGNLAMQNKIDWLLNNNLENLMTFKR